MTNEQESEIPLAVDLQSASSIADELLRISPPYTGPKDSEATVEQNAAYMLRRLAQRPRDMPEGVRIEGYVRKISPDVHERFGFYITDEIPDDVQSATLTIHKRKEGESDERQRP